MLLQDILTDKADVWFGQSSIRGIICAFVTNYIVDYYTAKQYLQVLALVGYQDVPLEAYRHGLDMIRQYAASKRCWKVVMYTANVRLLSILKQYGADIDWHYIEIKTLEA